MPNLCDSLQCSNFLNKLRAAERNTEAMTEWELDFIKDMRLKFDGRDDAIDMGCTAWNPSANQWNTLSLLAEKYS